METEHYYIVQEDCYWKIKRKNSGFFGDKTVYEIWGEYSNESSIMASLKTTQNIMNIFEGGV